MNNILIKWNALLKGIILWMRPHVVFGFLSGGFKFISNLLYLSSWISKQDRKGILNDFFTTVRDHNKRETLYLYVAEKCELKQKNFLYLEFGVYKGSSFRWWMNYNNNPHSAFFGFDTFEGLPEDWGIFFDKGTFATAIPEMNDSRGKFVKGLFQDTLPTFISQQNLHDPRMKIIHMDADLFSSTIYTLSLLSPYLKKGDLILFDEFNVPNHEFAAFKIITDSFYLKTKLIGAVNNYYQIALEVL
ncbi:MAG: class I SAM-dependent methyltransferase [Saprospiraceae bacterium]